MPDHCCPRSQFGFMGQTLHQAHGTNCCTEGPKLLVKLMIRVWNDWACDWACTCCMKGHLVLALKCVSAVPCWLYCTANKGIGIHVLPKCRVKSAILCQSHKTTVQKNDATNQKTVSSVCKLARVCSAGSNSPKVPCRLAKEVITRAISSIRHSSAMLCVRWL